VGDKIPNREAKRMSLWLKSDEWLFLRYGLRLGVLRALWYWAELQRARGLAPGGIVLWEERCVIWMLESWRRNLKTFNSYTLLRDEMWTLGVWRTPPPSDASGTISSYKSISSETWCRNHVFVSFLRRAKEIYYRSETAVKSFTSSDGNPPVGRERVSSGRIGFWWCSSEASEQSATPLKIASSTWGCCMRIGWHGLLKMESRGLSRD